MYQRSVTLYKHEKYNILTSELLHRVKTFDEKLYICGTRDKHLIKNEITRQTA